MKIIRGGIVLIREKDLLIEMNELATKNGPLKPEELRRLEEIIKKLRSSETH